MALALACAWPIAALAQLPLDDDREETYDLGERTIAEFFDSFLSDQGLSVDVSDAVAEETRTLRGERSGTPREIFRSLLDTNQLVAYFDGRTIHVYKENEVGRRFLAVPEERMDAAQRAIADVTGEGDVNSVSDIEPGLLRVTGVPQFLDESAELAQAFMQTGEEEQEMVFRFFPLENAWAADREFRAGNRTMMVPGVATVLRQLVGGTAGGGSGPMVDRNRRSESLRGEGLSRHGGEDRDDAQRALSQITQSQEAEESDDADTGEAQSEQRVEPSSGGGPSIVSAPGGNGVIVKDTADRMPMYAQLIESLDQERQVVEVQATIININVDRLQQLGVDFRAAEGNGDSEAIFGEEGAKEDFLNTLAADDVAALGQLPGFQLGAILDDDGNLIARLNALADEGAARIVSRPTVVTLNGLEAVVESSEQVFVPVEGAFEVDLFDVFAGTVLRVTPQVGDADDDARIRMFINVDDGEIESPLVEGSEEGRRQPRVTRNAVTTQASIRDGQSLLLGGLIEEQAVQEETKVPLLGDVPVVGALFRNRTETQDRIERLFLLTPRLVDPDNLARDGGDQLPSASEEALDEFESDDVIEPQSNDDALRSNDDSAAEEEDDRDILRRLP
ncbi:type III secretion system outer membrane ring subunit SctC [Halochromatium sp.]|uniref:type III secretion system outer membrane ring subunit SctC n=1 Tax=Halochromatium sp. TaxID=2049430 RepID=UPI00397A96A8